MAKAKTEKKEKVEKPKVDLFLSLDKITSGDIEFFNKMPPDEKKQLAPLIVMRWLSGVQDKKQILQLNHIVNQLVFSIHQHPDLLLKLMMASSTDAKKRFRYIKKETTSKHPISMDILERWYKCSTSEAKQYFPLHTKEDILEMASDLGEDQALIEKLKKE